jgi:PAS domain S-box-containing protein
MGYNFGNPYSLLLLANTVLLVVLVVVLGRYRERRAAQGLIGVLVGAAIWSAADGIRLAASTRGEILLWNRLSYVGVALIPPAFLLFVVAQTDHEEWLRRRYVTPVVAISVGAVLTALTNPWHELWRADETVTPGSPPPILIEEFGIVHVLWDLYILLFVVPLGVGLLVRRLRTEYTSPVVRRQLFVILFAVSVPVFTSALFATRLLKFDITPFALAMTGLAMTLATMEYRLFDIVPIARDTVLENIESGVLVVDPENNIVDANARAVELLDISRDELVGTTMTALVATLPDVPEYFGSVEETEETIAVEPDADTKRYYDVTVSPVETGSGRTAGRVVLFSDVTEQIERREQLEAQKLRLEAKNERLNEFAGLVSHDLRNPIQVIDANLELIDDPENEQRIETIADATDRMADIVDQVLTLARTGGEVTETEIVVLSAMSSRVWNELSPRDGATLEIEVSKTVDADRGSLRQCFENIFKNSLEHGGDDVTVTVGELADGFYVEDDGAGFPEDVLDADDSVVDHYASQGRYGLQIIENTVDAHGWDLTITESDDGGARFEIRTE